MLSGANVGSISIWLLETVRRSLKQHLFLFIQEVKVNWSIRSSPNFTILDWRRTESVLTMKNSVIKFGRSEKT